MQIMIASSYLLINFCCFDTESFLKDRIGEMYVAIDNSAIKKGMWNELAR